MNTRKTRPYILGLSIGTFWLIAASLGFSIQGLVSAGTSITRMTLGPVLVLAAALLALSFIQIRAALRLPAQPRTAARRSIGRRFVFIVVLEVAGIVLANLACFLTGHLSWMVPLNLMIVGVHFIPLAKLFGVPRYYVLGAAFCAIPALALFWIPEDMHYGAAVSRFLFSTLGCTAAAWSISIANIGEVRRLLK